MSVTVQLTGDDGEVENDVVVNDDEFLIICGRDRYVATRTIYPKSGTEAVYIKTREAS